MLDQHREDSTETPDTAHYDLIVVGAGIAGLNALYAAAQYLPASARVLLLDQKDAPGGMWTMVYDYVRLHQPHPMFTVGDIPWNWRKPRDYLASRDEVQRHLAGTLAPVAERVALTAEFGRTVTTCEEVRTDAGWRARVTHHPNGQPDKAETAMADRVIHAAGLNYRAPEPLDLSSEAVLSIAPADLRATLAAHPGAPVVVVGGGKTGMDTVLATLNESPGREVTLIKGRGTSFLNRGRFLPQGFGRWTRGKPVSRIFHDMATTFDGTNEDETVDHFRRSYATDPGTANGLFLYGILSVEEHARITGGVSRCLADYLADVRDTDAAPRMEMRSGDTHPVPAGSIFVNCTGSFFRDADLERTLPCLSEHHTVMSLNTRDAMHMLSSVCGFFMTHMLYRGALPATPIYMLDHEDLFRKNRNAWVGATSAQAYMNQTLAVQTLPLRLLDACGLDFDRWYPLPRRMLALLKMKTGAARDLAHCRKVLDRVAERFDVHCAPIG